MSTLILVIILFNSHDYPHTITTHVTEFRSHRACVRAEERVKEQLRQARAGHHYEVTGKCYKD